MIDSHTRSEHQTAVQDRFPFSAAMRKLVLGPWGSGALPVRAPQYRKFD